MQNCFFEIKKHCKIASEKPQNASQKSPHKPPRAKVVLDKIKSKNDIIASQKITKGQRKYET
ncbi:hypothetical protein [Helicobacter macacae]|uniref:hypothetical protein n=1 Tax=Helicobacter macacae TaxID=398626 RepID=UPI000405EC47|nr:hypothetical protein [Helicobacter macacae]